MLSELITNNKIVGTKQVKRALNSQDLKAVFIARDAENKVTDEIIDICKDKHVEVIYVDNMKKLGDACGIDVNAAVAALIK
ncbi:MAG TPA: 50S ribosomal protein L7ae-like protein [Clostridiales bacterium]|nr:50S ribosomal protein L7ae-like protein [Clostridiales bacterium]